MGITDNYRVTDWLPTSAKEVMLKGWAAPDVILFTGDAYIDHPTFGAAVIGRILENSGFRVAIVPQPNWRDDLRDFKKLGRPRLFFGVTSGCMDSMVNHYTAQLRKRSDDAYSPGGKSGFRPDYCVTVYSRILKEIYPDVPIVLGGIEASLRRLTHYDYWSDSLKPSILIDSHADILVYGMGEIPVTEIAMQLKKGRPVSSLTDIPQTAYVTDKYELTSAGSNLRTIEIASHKECIGNKARFATSFKITEEESNKINAARIVQKTGNKYVVVNPPVTELNQEDADLPYDLPYTRLPHPKYHNKAEIPAYKMIRHSINIHRGCFGGCSFCTISAHQGKFIQSRSERSVLKEVENIKKMYDFRGQISDLGGPSANMYRMQGIDKNVCLKCKKPSCVFPAVCRNLNTSHKPLLELYRKVRNTAGVKKVTIGSGIRYDLFLAQDGTPSNKDANDYITELIRYHVSGRLKVAPEHTDPEVLKLMRKPSFLYFIALKELFDKNNSKYKLKQQLNPYFISSHPASTTGSMAELAITTKKLRLNIEQVQDFTPTPMTLSSVIYFSGIHPYTLKKIVTPRTQHEKAMQKAFFFWYKKENRQVIINELRRLGKNNLVEKLYRT
jgi:uncharacterized radical SAM protein YgiQ